mmetsp:Transcript_30285/g.27579  ORF Transcript_30285/g.27579 Transcript_30285/m.27579 type:complete len:89 (+) Transcript_30285:1012-1278(+)
MCYLITNSGLASLLDGMNKRLSKLDLSFSQCSNITDDGLKKCKSLFEGLNQLRDCKMAFSKCWKITNNGLTDLKFDPLSVASNFKLIC